MTIEQIKAKIIELLKQVAPEVDFDTILPDVPIREELDIDSIDWLNFLVAIDEAFDIEIPESSYSELTSLTGLTDYIAKFLKKESPEHF